MSRPPLEVIIHGERGDRWLQLLGTRTFPVTTWEPFLADLPGLPNAKVYMLNVELIPREMLLTMADEIAQRFGAIGDEVLAEIEANGLPILAADCTVVLNDPQRWV